MAKYGPKPRPVEERFWAKVDVGDENDCWEWAGYRLPPMGYGRFGVTHGDIQFAHRVAWRLEHGEIPEGIHVLHTCDNPPCCNPAHLWLGTKKDNTTDMIVKGRQVNANARKTHCHQGHPLSGENLINTSSGRRRCKLCERERWRTHGRRWRRGT